MKTLKRLVLLSVLSIALAGCGPKPVSATTTTQRFEVLSVHPMKNSYVSLQHTETGQKLRSVYVGRRCRTMRTNVPVGSQWNLPQTLMRYEDGTSRVSVNARELCRINRQ